MGLTGYPGHLTDEEKKTLETFREGLKAAGYTQRLDDSTLVRIALIETGASRAFKY